MAGYTKLWDWVMANGELTLNEKMVYCRVLRWQGNDCYESNARMGKGLGIHGRTVQRCVESLVEKKWLQRFLLNKRFRVLLPHPDKLEAGPLFLKKFGVTAIKRIIVHSLRTKKLFTGSKVG